jgi:glutamine synthetase
MERESLMLKESLENTFASNVFNDVVMRARLPKNIYKMLRKTIDEGLPLAPEVADIVANAM